MAQQATGGPLHVSVITPEGSVFEGSAESVVIPAWDGEIGILQGHAPLMALLGEGQLRVRRHRETERFFVAGGFVQVIDNVVTVLSERTSVE